MSEIISKLCVNRASPSGRSARGDTMEVKSNNRLDLTPRPVTLCAE